MKRILAAAFVMLAAAVVAPGQAGKGAEAAGRQSQAEKEVRSLMREFVAALDRRDVAALNRIYADDMFFTNQSGALSTKKAEIDYIKSLPAAAYKGSTAEEKVRVYGDAAVVNGIYTVRDGGSLVFGPVRYTTVCVRQQKGWKIVSFQVTDLRRR